jgi:superfamily II DNA or RNA helicase
MRLSQVLGEQIPDRSRTRGYAYFLSGAVRSLTAENGIVEATVRGSDTYTVWIETGTARLRASCTCPYFIDRFDICKHVWAVVLAAEAQSLPLVPPGVRFNDVDLEPLYPDEDLDEDHDAWRPTAPRRLAPTPMPAWRATLDAIRSAAAPDPVPPRALAPKQLLYVVDAAAASGAVVVEVMTRDRKANGEWGKPKPARVTSADIDAHPDLQERQLLQRLLGARPQLSYGGWAGYGQELSRIELRGVLVSDLVPALCTTGRCMLRLNAAVETTVDASPPAQPMPTRRWSAQSWQAMSPSRSSAQQVTLAPIGWDDGPAWSFAMAIRHDVSAGRYVVEGWLARGDARMSLEEPVVFASDICFTRTHAARVSLGGARPWLAALRGAGRLEVPADAREDLIEALLASPPSPPTLAEVPDDLRVETVQGHPRPHLLLRSIHNRADRVRTDLAFDYDGTLVTLGAPQRVLRVAGSTRAIRRDIEAEQQALAALYTRGCRLEWIQQTGDRVLQIAATAVPRLVRQAMDDAWHVEAEGRIYRRPATPTIAVHSGIDWFELHGDVAYDDQRASLPALLAALDRGETFVTLGDGTMGLLPEEWLRRHALVARLGSPSGDHLRFKTTQAAILDALLAAQPDVSCDDLFARARAELQAFAGITPADPPPTFTGTLRAYQRDGLGWLLFLQRFGFGGCLADDMGLGKTVMVLALLAARRESHGRDKRMPSLVVAPRSLVFNWRQEAARFAPGLTVMEYVGAGRAALRAAFGEHDIVLTTYGTLRRDAVPLAAVPFDYVVLDEAQAIKNASSVSAKTTRLLQARHRLALSGTPIENHVGELWSLFEFLNPGLFGTARAFDRAAPGARLDDEALSLLARALRPFILRRTKAQVATELPAKTEQTVFCELERPQRALYDELRAHYRQTLLGDDAPSLGRAKLQVLEALLRLRQAACHPGLIDRRRAAEASAKLDVLVPRLIEAVDEGHKTLVFSQFTSLLAILRARLDSERMPYEYLDGRTRDRQSKVERFQTDPGCRLFLISLKAGGLGLNLTAAEYVFLLDPWWNPAVEAQAIDRAHRIGQARHVFAYRLIARDTVEERVLELQQHKRRLADAILTADNSVIRDLRREDLELLLS